MAQIPKTQISKATASTSYLSWLTGLDRRTVDKYLESQSVRRDPKNDEYPLQKSIQAFIACSKGQSSADRRNDAQAHVHEINARNMLRENIPKHEILEPVTMFVDMLNTLFQESEIEEKIKSKVYERKEELLDEMRKRLEE